jgi:hypothetical protein
VNRVHAPEFEDFAWFPAVLRDGLTDMLSVSATTLRVFDPAISVLKRMLEQSGSRRIVDLCSGGGGPLLSLVDALERSHGMAIEVVLTDKFPNAQAFARAERKRPRVTALRASIDATEVPRELSGVRTLFNALHHFRPQAARALFADAVRKRQPIAAFEVVERSPTAALMIAAVPSVIMALTPLSRPLSLSRLGLTYGLPLIPALGAWDGMASCLRAYSPRELRALVAGLEREDYVFAVEQHWVRHLPVRVTCLSGMPR